MEPVKVEYKLFSCSGRLVAAEPGVYVEGIWKRELASPSLTAGVYILQATINGKQITRKVVKL